MIQYEYVNIAGKNLYVISVHVHSFVVVIVPEDIIMKTGGRYYDRRLIQ